MAFWLPGNIAGNGFNVPQNFPAGAPRRLLGAGNGVFNDNGVDKPVSGFSVLDLGGDPGRGLPGAPVRPPSWMAQPQPHYNFSTNLDTAYSNRNMASVSTSVVFEIFFTQMYWTSLAVIPEATKERNFQHTVISFAILPMTAKARNVPGRTNTMTSRKYQFHSEQRVGSIQMDSQLMQDPNFGPQTLAWASYGTSASARMTIVLRQFHQIITHSAKVMFQTMNRVLQAGGTGRVNADEALIWMNSTLGILNRGPTAYTHVFNQALRDVSTNNPGANQIIVMPEDLQKALIENISNDMTQQILAYRMLLPGGVQMITPPENPTAAQLGLIPARNFLNNQGGPTGGQRVYFATAPDIPITDEVSSKSEIHSYCSESEFVYTQALKGVSSLEPHSSYNPGRLHIFSRLSGTIEALHLHEILEAACVFDDTGLKYSNEVYSYIQRLNSSGGDGVSPPISSNEAGRRLIRQAASTLKPFNAPVGEEGSMCWLFACWNPVQSRYEPAEYAIQLDLENLPTPTVQAISRQLANRYRDFCVMSQHLTEFLGILDSREMHPAWIRAVSALASDKIFTTRNGRLAMFLETANSKRKQPYSVIAQIPGNLYGGIDLPSTMPVAAPGEPAFIPARHLAFGTANGPNILTLMREASNPSSIYRELGQKADAIYKEFSRCWVEIREAFCTSLFFDDQCVSAWFASPNAETAFVRYCECMMESRPLFLRVEIPRSLTSPTAPKKVSRTFVQSDVEPGAALSARLGKIVGLGLYDGTQETFYRRYYGLTQDNGEGTMPDFDIKQVIALLPKLTAAVEYFINAPRIRKDPTWSKMPRQNVELDFAVFFADEKRLDKNGNKIEITPDMPIKQLVQSFLAWFEVGANAKATTDSQGRRDQVLTASATDFFELNVNQNAVPDAPDIAGIDPGLVNELMDGRAAVLTAFEDITGSFTDLNPLYSRNFFKTVIDPDDGEISYSLADIELTTKVSNEKISLSDLAGKDVFDQTTDLGNDFDGFTNKHKGLFMHNMEVDHTNAKPRYVKLAEAIRKYHKAVIAVENNAFDLLHGLASQSNNDLPSDVVTRQAIVLTDEIRNQIKDIRASNIAPAAQDKLIESLMKQLPEGNLSTLNALTTQFFMLRAPMTVNSRSSALSCYNINLHQRAWCLVGDHSTGYGTPALTADNAWYSPNNSISPNSRSDAFEQYKKIAAVRGAPIEPIAGGGAPRYNDDDDDDLPMFDNQPRPAQGRGFFFDRHSRSPSPMRSHHEQRGRHAQRSADPLAMRQAQAYIPGTGDVVPKVLGLTEFNGQKLFNNALWQSPDLSHLLLGSGAIDRLLEMYQSGEKLEGAALMALIYLLMPINIPTLKNLSITRNVPFFDWCGIDQRLFATAHALVISEGMDVIKLLDPWTTLSVENKIDRAFFNCRIEFATVPRKWGGGILINHAFIRSCLKGITARAMSPALVRDLLNNSVAADSKTASLLIMLVPLTAPRPNILRWDMAKPSQMALKLAGTDQGEVVTISSFPTQNFYSYCYVGMSLKLRQEPSFMQMLDRPTLRERVVMASEADLMELVVDGAPSGITNYSFRGGWYEHSPIDGRLTFFPGNCPLGSEECNMPGAEKVFNSTNPLFPKASGTISLTAHHV